MFRAQIMDEGLGGTGAGGMVVFGDGGSVVNGDADGDGDGGDTHTKRTRDPAADIDPPPPPHRSRRPSAPQLAAAQAIDASDRVMGAAAVGGDGEVGSSSRSDIDDEDDDDGIPDVVVESADEDD